MEKNFKRCRICNIPLNREIVSKKDPELCFRCAEEHRKFTPKKEKETIYTSESIAEQFGEKQAKQSFWDRLKFWK
jgi:hypothetical protein